MKTAMKVCLIALLCCVTVHSYRPLPGPAHQGLAPWTDLRVKFSEERTANGYFKMPLSKTEATHAGWTKPPEDNNRFYGILCPSGDPTVCVMYGFDGLIHGIEIGFQVADVAGYPISRHPTFERKRRFGLDVYVVTVFTVKPGTVRSSRLEIGDGLWMAIGPQGVRMYEIPSVEKRMSSTAFTRGGCIPGMGRHYFYNISKHMDCGDFEPLSPLYSGGELTGFAIITWGRATYPSTKVAESFPPEFIQNPLPDPPQCMLDNGVKFGTISLHVFFVDKPWLIQC